MPNNPPHAPAIMSLHMHILCTMAYRFLILYFTTLLQNDLRFYIIQRSKNVCALELSNMSEKKIVVFFFFFFAMTLNKATV